METNRCLECLTVPTNVRSSRRRGSGLVRGLCPKCYGRHHARGTLDTVGLPAKGFTGHEPGTRVTNNNGYVMYYPLDGGKGVLEHRHVMEVYIGRSLVKGENVHHKNGVRDDNRLDNLELWHTTQPYGQRVEELMDYLVEHHREALLARF